MLLTPLAQRYQHFLLDLDGCIWVGDEPTQDAAAAVAALRAAGKSVSFVTNDARASGEEFVRKLWRLGLQASLEEVVTAGGALQHVLAERGGGNAFVIGAASVHRHTADAGCKIVNGTEFAPRADVVVVSGHEEIHYSDLRTATQAVARGADLLATDRDRSFPMPDGPWPGTGAALAAIEFATGREGRAVGKPAAQLFETALDRVGGQRALVVGDRLDADLAGASAAGLDAAIVLSGATTADEAGEAKDPAPVAIEATLADLLLER